jgi:hypothetical protein
MRTFRDVETLLEHGDARREVILRCRAGSICAPGSLVPLLFFLSFYNRTRRLDAAREEDGYRRVKRPRASGKSVPKADFCNPTRIHMSLVQNRDWQSNDG